MSNLTEYNPNPDAKNPALSVGAVSAAVGAVLTALVAFGVDRPGLSPFWQRTGEDLSSIPSTWPATVGPCSTSDSPATRTRPAR